MRVTFLTFVFVVSLFVGIVQAYREEEHRNCEVMAKQHCGNGPLQKYYHNCLCYYWTNYNEGPSCEDGCYKDYIDLYNGDKKTVRTKCSISCAGVGPEGCQPFKGPC
ncbi:unnamed protein product [Tilletia controversa]|nr:unnamed protein product [Tilletia controversa]